MTVDCIEVGEYGFRTFLPVVFLEHVNKGPYLHAFEGSETVCFKVYKERKQQEPLNTDVWLNVTIPVCLQPRDSGSDTGSIPFVLAHLAYQVLHV